MATTTTTTKKTTASTTKAKNVTTESNEQIEALQKENEALQKQIEEIKAMLSQQTKSNEAVAERSTKFLPEEDITVISLVPHKLNLATGRAGEGNLYEFMGMYEEQEIPWADLQAIIRIPTGRKMAKNGKFFIANEQAVKSLRLTTDYKKILTPERIKEVLDANQGSLVELYKMAPDGQKQIIIEIIKEKRRKHVEMDMNDLHTIGELAGVDLVNVIDPNED